MNMLKTIVINFTKNINNLFIKKHIPPPLGRWNRGDKKFINYYDNCFTTYPYEFKDNKINNKKF